MSPAPQKPLLAIHQGALGDFVATFPVLRALNSLFRPIDAICRDSFGALAQFLGLIRRHEPLEAARFATLYSQPLDPAVQRLLQDYHSILLFSFSETLEKSIRSEHRSVFRIPPWPGAQEKVAVTRFLARRLVHSGIFEFRDPKLFKKALGGSGNLVSADQKDRILLAPGAGSLKKRWPLDGFLTLAEHLGKNGCRPEILLGPVETDLQAQLAKCSGSVPPQIRPPTLVALAQHLANCGGFIGNDSAAGHLAAFTGVPTVVIFGPTDPLRWAPFGAYVRVVQSGAVGRSAFDAVRPEGDPSDHGMESIAPEEVMGAFSRVRRHWLKSQGGF